MSLLLGGAAALTDIVSSQSNHRHSVAASRFSHSLFKSFSRPLPACPPSRTRHLQCSSARCSEPLRVFALTDVHTDYEENLAWIDSLAQRGYREQDVLILSGDVSDDLTILRRTLASLRRTFGRVFFVPGNHDLWLRGEPCDSRWLQKHITSTLGRNWVTP